jgi:hypothetical protein
LHERVSALVITESTADGAVTVEVGADGTLRGLVLRDRGHPADHYASEIMACIATAQARIPALVEKAVDRTVGAADPGAHAVLDGLRKRFPQPEPATSPWAKPATRDPKPRRPVDEDVDDWAGSRIMEDI